MTSGRRPEAAPQFFEDFVDLLSELNRERVRFIVVGAYALAAHGVPRATGDLDVWVDPEPGNAARVHRALVRFGAPLGATSVTPADLAFTVAWRDRLRSKIGSQRCAFLGRAALLRNKRAMSRAKDLADVELLERQASKRRRPKRG